ncbi:MAG: MATE family efflux transporter [Clostridia bacterium]|nr:MATE family efflux transporter [Clostridia bacterium]
MARSNKYEMDMTQGALLPKVLLFSLPLIASGILQLLFNAADMVVVGRWAGKECLAAVGSTGSLINLMVNVFIGLSVGGSVAVAKSFGAGDPAAVHKAVHTAMTLAIIAGLAVGLIGFIFCKPLLRMMDNPVLDLATTYMKIYFLGMPFNMIYNFGASILRAVGDTRRPLIYLTIAGVVNVILNLILVIVFHMNVAGVAIATVASQAVSAVLVVICLMRSHGIVHLDVKELRIHKRQLIDIARVGLPAGLQGSLFSISNVLIQSSVNGFGEVVVAANAAGGNLEGFVYTSMNAIHQAALTFASQNLGAGKIKRVRRSVWVCVATVTVIGLVMGNLMLLFGRPLLSLYLDDPMAIDLATGVTVLDYGMKRLTWMLPLYCLCGLMDVMVGSLRGVGYSVMPMIVSLTGACLFRVVWILTVFAANPTLDILYLSYPISWALTFGVHMLCYLFIARKKLGALEARIGQNE